jgi:hypothetical protein
MTWEITLRAALACRDVTVYPAQRAALLNQLVRWWVPSAYAADRDPPPQGRWAVTDDALRAGSHDHAVAIVTAIMTVEDGCCGRTVTP